MAKSQGGPTPESQVRRVGPDRSWWALLSLGISKSAESVPIVPGRPRSAPASPSPSSQPRPFLVGPAQLRHLQVRRVGPDIPCQPRSAPTSPSPPSQPRPSLSAPASPSQPRRSRLPRVGPWAILAVQAAVFLTRAAWHHLAQLPSGRAVDGIRPNYLPAPLIDGTWLTNRHFFLSDGTGPANWPRFTPGSKSS